MKPFRPSERTGKGIGLDLIFGSVLWVVVGALLAGGLDLLAVNWGFTAALLSLASLASVLTWHFARSLRAVDGRT